jgi:hypothetical protein
VAVDDADRFHADETRRKLFVRRHLTERSPLWPGAMPPFDAAELAGPIGARVDALLGVMLAGFAGGFLRLLLCPVRRSVRARMTKKAVATLAEAVEAHGLNDPLG